MQKRVLIVDDSPYIRSLIRNVLENNGYEVVGEADNGEKAIDLAFELQPDVITLDNILPDMVGTDILKVLKDQNIKSKVLMISAVGQQSVIDIGMELGADEYVVKPFDDDELLEIINRVTA